MSGHLRVIASVRSLYTEVIFMQSQVNFSYFYGEESEQFSYFRRSRQDLCAKLFAGSG